MQIFNKKLFIIIIFVLFLSTLNINALNPLTDTAMTANLEPRIVPVKGPEQALKETTGADMNADEIEFIGDNMLAKGNVSVRKGDLLLYADLVIVNNTTKNIELSGNVKFFTMVSSRAEMEYWDLKELQKDPFTKLKVVGTVMTPAGRQKLIVDVINEEMAWSGKRAAGNITTGVYECGNFVSKFGNWYVKGDNGTVLGSGKVKMDWATITPCENLIEGITPVFSIQSARFVGYPPLGHPSPAEGTSSDADRGGNYNEYHFLGYSNVLYIGAIPVLWLPVVYKPPKRDLGKWGIKVGSNSDWGFFVQTTNYWGIIDTEDVSLGITNMIDYYGRRGWALGNQTELYTKDTKTEFFIYGQVDGNHNLQVPINSRFGQLNPFRYALTLKNISNITDRMSFRGQLAKLSDMYYLYDFFNNIALVDPQPATYGSVDYQFDHASASLMIRPRINNFYSVVQSLPRLDITAPRQELFENIYYQSETSLGYFDMKWRDFKIAPTGGLTSPSDYASFRFDTTHFVYYPLKLDWINIIPRAGLKMTAYGSSSSTEVSSTDLDKLISAQAPDSQGGSNLVNYDSSGGGKFRIIPEFGIQVNSKISRSWNDVKNAYFDMNGLRHVYEPYLNYTFTTKPTVNRDNLYYFDDVDRIDEQNWLRIGMENRLQTRRGNWGNSQVYTWASMENYVDLIFNERPFAGEGWKNLGGIGTLLTLRPSENLSFNMQFLVEGSKLDDFSNLLKAVNKASFDVKWEFAENWNINAGYYFGSESQSQGVYSMGSNISTVQAGSVFIRNFSASNYANVNLNFQINERTAGIISCAYDFQQNLMPSLNLSLIRALPCGLELLLTLGISKQNDANVSGGTQIKESLSISLGFSSSSDYVISPRENLLPESVPSPNVGF